MKSFRAFVDFDKEEEWLGRKAAEGWLVVDAGFGYTFAPIEPGSAVVRVDYRSSMSAADFADYRNLFLDAGWQHVAGTRSSGAQYFAAPPTRADAEIFSDSDSKAQRYRRAMGMTSALLLPFAVIIVALWPQVGGSFEYLTPGLWEMEGWEFVRAFAFETPFVVLRAALPLVLFAAVAVFAWQLVWQWMLYRRALRSAVS